MGNEQFHNGDSAMPERPKLLGPKRRWWFLAIWVVVLLAVLVAQRATANSFEHGYWTPAGCTEPTDAEMLWYWLPVSAIILTAVVFMVGLRWWVPEKGTRGTLRAWGFLFSLLSIITSGLMSCFYRLDFYMD